MTFYHTTTPEAANEIASSAFRDDRGMYGTDCDWPGVWLSTEPLSSSEGTNEGAILVLEIPEQIVEPFEWVEEGKSYREFLIPADIVNLQAIVHSREM